MTPVLDADQVIRTLRQARDRESARRGLLERTAQQIRAAGEPYTGVYVYMLHGERLILEAYAGAPTEHTEIPVGQGLCGRAVQNNEDLVVGDVSSQPDYIACNVSTRSELICLIRNRDEVIGQIDVDSDQSDGFPPEEQAQVRKIADALGELL